MHVSNSTLLMQALKLSTLIREKRVKVENHSQTHVTNTVIQLSNTANNTVSFN